MNMPDNIQPLVSIIIPFYNVENYFIKCLQSVFSQDYENLEIILVDDGSTDESAILAKRIMANYPLRKSKLVSKKNGGQSSARNEGLNHASGFYVWFIDSDDFIEPCSVSILVKTMLENPLSDFCCFRSCFFDGKNRVLSGASFEGAGIDNKDEILKDFLLCRNVKVTLWDKFFKLKLIKEGGLRLLEGIINEDYLFMMEVCLESDNIVFLNHQLYTATIRPNSVSRTIKPQTVTDYFIIAERIKHLLIREGAFDRYKDYYYASIIKNMLFSLVQSAFKVDNYTTFNSLYKLLRGSYYFESETRKGVYLLDFKIRCLYHLSLRPWPFYSSMRILKKCHVFMY